MSSASRNVTNWQPVRMLSSPVLRAAAMPLRGFWRRRTSVKSAAMAATIVLVSSVDPSSITMMSRSTTWRSRSSERIAHR